MQQHFLLTGAGFSRNWGGWVADEAFEYLLGSSHTDEPLRELLWRDKNNGLGFEDSLATLQEQYELQERDNFQPHGWRRLCRFLWRRRDRNWSPQVEQNLTNLTSGLQRMFGDMTLGFSRQPFEFCDDPEIQVSEFLSKFNAIFTLNQDTLLEAKYFGTLKQKPFIAGGGIYSPNYADAYRPGIIRALDTLAYGSLANRINLFKPEPEPFILKPDLQPYFKLHGSADFQVGARETMLILGGNKPERINKQPLLRWYHELFRRHLEIPDARLMVIGYSFGDPHINEIIINGVKCGLRLFIIDLAGVDVIGRRSNISPDNVSLLKNSVIGASRRPLSMTFGGEDMIEFRKINRFFRSARMDVTYHPAF